MKLNVAKWYKDANLLGITTLTNKHICNIYLTNLLQVCAKYDTVNGTVDVNNLFQLLDASVQIFDTKETKIYENIKQNYLNKIDKSNIESASEQLFNKYL